MMMPPPWPVMGRKSALVSNLAVAADMVGRMPVGGKWIVDVSDGGGRSVYG